MSRKRVRFRAVDLFAGCGGLSLGLRRAGIRVSAAVEIDERAAKTYRKNFPRTKLLRRDIRDVTAFQIRQISGGRPEIVVGCAPCQGFCSLTRKYERKDPRNELLLEMGRLIKEIRPTAVMMENVPGLLTYGRLTFKRFVARLRRAGYYCSWQVVQMADHGVPQSRRRLVFLAGRGFRIPLPAATHSRRANEELRAWVPVRDALRDIGPPVRLRNAAKKGGPAAFNWHVVRDLKPQTRARLKAAIPGKTWLSLDEDIRPKCHQGKYRGFTNVYGRMVWDDVAPTITTGCTTPAKGRFGHPDRRRTTISVREAALLQTFPENYRFCGDHIDGVCEMIGNAVPPLYAFAAGKQVASSLKAQRHAMAKTKQ